MDLQLSCSWVLNFSCRLFSLQEKGKPHGLSFSRVLSYVWECLISHAFFLNQGPCTGLMMEPPPLRSSSSGEQFKKASLLTMFHACFASRLLRLELICWSQHQRNTELHQLTTTSWGKEQTLCLSLLLPFFSPNVTTPMHLYSAWSKP